MPHDKNGTPLSVGDRVSLEGVVKAVTPEENYCNLTIEIDPMPPYTNPQTLSSLNTKQVIKVGEPTHAETEAVQEAPEA